MTQGPPAEVREQVNAAWERAGALARAGYGLHFDHGSDGRLVIDLRTARGEVLRKLTPLAALDVMHRPD